MKKAYIQVFLAMTLLYLLGADKTTAQNNLEYIGTYDSLSLAVAVEVDSGFAYVADAGMGLVIFAVSDSTNPYMVGMYNPSPWAFDLDVKGNTAYLATGLSEPYMGRLDIIDVSNRQNPILLGSYSGQWEFMAVEVDDYAYVASWGCFILDISDPANPVLISNISGVSGATDLYKRGNYLYLAAYNQGLKIVDVADPHNPQVVGTCETPGIAKGVTLRTGGLNANSYAYIADGDSGLQIINIIDPANPFIAGRYRTSGAINDVTAGDFYVYATVGNSSLEIIEVGLPWRPRRVGFSDHPPMAEGVGLDDIIAVSGGEAIETYRLTLCPCDYVVGDVNGNGIANGIDVTYAVFYFKGGNPPPDYCPCPPHGSIYVAGDVNGDCAFNGLDILFFVNRLRTVYPELLPCPDCPPGY